jgi:hypothetical protein
MFRSTVTSLAFLVGLFAFAGQPTQAGDAASAVPAPTPESAAFKDYKGVSIGMAAQAVRKALGDPKEKSDPVDLYIFSNEESAQFFYGDDKTVNAIMITYTGDLKKAPTPMTIFGVEAAPAADGGIFKMIRYPKAGFWISYNRTAGDDAVISIAVQKL